MPTFVADELVTALKLNAATARDWTTWAPTYANLTVGNGTVVARYIQVGKLVVARWSFTLGSSSSVGTSPTVAAPVTAGSYTVPRNVVGHARFDDVSGAVNTGIVRLENTTTFTMFVDNTAGTYAAETGVTATVPFTWATTDILSFVATYEVA